VQLCIWLRWGIALLHVWLIYRITMHVLPQEACVLRDMNSLVD